MNQNFNDIIVGSKALLNHGILLRSNIASNSDIDLITIDKPKYCSATDRVDYLANSELYNILLPYCTPIKGTVLLLPNIKTLYLLKLSHMNQNIHWNKHSKDIMAIYPYVIPFTKEDKILFNNLYNFWVKYYPLKPINLNKKPEEFFNIVTPEQHEIHHEHFKLGDRPVYTKFLKDEHDVMIDINKFFSLSKENQFNCIWEESMVIAYERNLPLLKGLQKVLCDLSKGEWNKFMVWNLVQILKFYSDIYPFYIKQSNLLKGVIY